MKPLSNQLYKHSSSGIYLFETNVLRNNDLNIFLSCLFPVQNVPRKINIFVQLIIGYVYF